MKFFAFGACLLAALLAGAAMPVAAPFISNCEVIVRQPVPPSPYASVDLATTENSVAATITVSDSNIVRLRLDGETFFKAEGGKKITEALDKNKETKLVYTWNGETRIVATGTINGRKIKEETFIVGDRKAEAPVLSRVGEYSAGNGRSAVSFNLFHKELKFLFEEVSSKASE